MPTIKINKEELTFNNIYYCNSISGNDNYNGLMSGTPFKTISKAISKVADNVNTAIILAANSIFIGLVEIPANKQITFIGELEKDNEFQSIPVIRVTANNCIRNSCNNIKFIKIRIEDLGNNGAGGWNAYSVLIHQPIININAFFYNCYLKPRGIVFSGGSNIKVYNCIIDYDKHKFNSEIFSCTGAPSGLKLFYNTIVLDIMTSRTVRASDTAVFTYSIVPTSNMSYHNFTDSTNKRLETTINIIDNKGKLAINESYWQNSGTGYNPDDTRAHIGVYGGPYAWGDWVYNKYFIMHNNIYKVYDENTTTWSTPVGNDIPTLTDYEEYGMETIPVNNLRELEGSKKLVTYFEDDATTKNMELLSIPKTTIIKTNNVSLSDVHEIKSITLTATNNNNSILKLSISPNDGNEWFVYRDNEWYISNDIKVDGNTIEEFNTINEAFNAILNINDKKLMFKFYMSLNNINDKLEVDKLSYTVDLKGIFEKVIDTKYRQLYTTNSTVKLELFEDGVYKINY